MRRRRVASRRRAEHPHAVLDAGGLGRGVRQGAYGLDGSRARRVEQGLPRRDRGRSSGRGRGSRRCASRRRNRRDDIGVAAVRVGCREKHAQAGRKNQRDGRAGDQAEGPSLRCGTRRARRVQPKGRIQVHRIDPCPATLSEHSPRLGSARFILIRRPGAGLDDGPSESPGVTTDASPIRAFWPAAARSASRPWSGRPGRDRRASPTWRAARPAAARPAWDWPASHWRRA